MSSDSSGGGVLETPFLKLYLGAISWLTLLRFRWSKSEGVIDNGSTGVNDNGSLVSVDEAFPETDRGSVNMARGVTDTDGDLTGV